MNSLSAEIVDTAVKVHRELGPGLMESIYQQCMMWELGDRGIPFNSQVRVPILYRGAKIEAGLCLNLLVDDTIIVELKSVAQVLEVHDAQILTYLRIAKKPLGLLFNFNVRLMNFGIKRFNNSPLSERPIEIRQLSVRA